MGSPGATRIRMKTTVSRISTIGRTSANRVRTYVRNEPVDAAMARDPQCGAVRGHRLTDVPAQESALAYQPEPEDVGRVERLLDAVNVVANHADLLNLHVRDLRRVAGADR